MVMEDFLLKYAQGGLGKSGPAQQALPKKVVGNLSGLKYIVR